MTASEEERGLGLSICKQICAMTGGKIELQSSVNRGTLVTFSVDTQFSPFQDEENRERNHTDYLKYLVTQSKSVVPEISKDF